MDHVKPTKEELEAGAQKALEEAEKLKEVEENEEPTSESENLEEGDGDQEEVSNDEENDETSGSEGDDEEKEDVVEQSAEEKAKELEEKNKKLQEKNKFSAQEAIILHSTNKKIQDSITEAADMPAPTDEEMAKLYSSWEDMDEFSQKMARDSEWNSRKIQAVTSVSQEFKDYNAWKTKVDSFIDDPTTVTNTPLLEGKEEEFKTFALKPTRRGADFEDLVRSFLYDAEPVKVNKGKQLDTTSSKGKDSKASTKLSAEQGKQLRDSDYKKWLEMSKKGMIDTGL